MNSTPKFEMNQYQSVNQRNYVPNQTNFQLQRKTTTNVPNYKNISTNNYYNRNPQKKIEPQKPQKNKLVSEINRNKGKEDILEDLFGSDKNVLKNDKPVISGSKTPSKQNLNQNNPNYYKNFPNQFQKSIPQNMQKPNNNLTNPPPNTG